MMVLFLALSVRGFAFQNEPEGFRGLEWGDPPGEDMVFFDIVKNYPDLVWYQRRYDRLRIGTVKLVLICYLFYKNRLMQVQIEPVAEEGGYDSLREILEREFGAGQRTEGLGRSSKWIGDITEITLQEERLEWTGLFGNASRGLLRFTSTKIYNQAEEDNRRKEEEEKRKEEKLKAAAEGLTDFGYIPETKKEKKESNIEEKVKTEKLKKVIFNGEEASDEEKIKPILPEVQPFFDLSTPENTVRSFIEVIVLEDDNKKAVECWSRRTPEFLTILLVNVAQEGFREGFKETTEEESPDPEIVKFGLNLFSYEKEQIDGESFYVWYVAPDGSNSKEDLTFRVVKENSNWKILMLKGMEDIPPLSNLLEKVEATERKFKDFSTPENTLRTFEEAAILRDRQLMKQCWSKETPGRMLDEILERAASIFAEYDLEGRKKFLGRITYKVDRYIDESTCYVYYIIKEEKSPVKFKVKKEVEEWKILMAVQWEENEEPGEDLEKREGIRGSGQGPEIEGPIISKQPSKTETKQTSKQVYAMPIEGYQQAKWGMSPQEVEQIFLDKSFIELRDPDPKVLGEETRRKTEASLTYAFGFEDEIANSWIRISFHFFENQLYKVKIGPGLFCFLKEEVLMKALIEKYGNPTDRDRKGNPIWTDEGNHLIILDGNKIEYLDVNRMDEIIKLIEMEDERKKKETMEKAKEKV